MRSAELITLGVEGKLLDHLRQWCQDHGSWLREVTKPDSCLNLLREGSSGVVLIRVGRDLEKEFDLLTAIVDGYPRIRVVMLGQIDHPTLAGLAWHLGAHAVLFPPFGLPELMEMLPRLFHAAERQAGWPGCGHA